MRVPVSLFSVILLDFCSLVLIRFGLLGRLNLNPMDGFDFIWEKRVES